MDGGWAGLTLSGVYPAITLLHFWFTAIKPFPSDAVSRPLLWAVGSSHMLLVVAILLQGDSCGWLTITALLGQRGQGLEGCHNNFWAAMTLPLFIPVAISWIWIWRLSRRCTGQAVQVSSKIVP